MNSTAISDFWDIFIEDSSEEPEDTYFSSENQKNISSQPCIYTVISNASNSLSETYLLYKIIIDVYFVGILCLAGFVGNILSIVVLNRDQEKQNTTNWLLQTLAAVDIVYLAADFFIQPVKTVHDLTDWGPRSLKVFFPYIEPYIWGVASIAQTSAVWLVLLVTVDRYMAVCLPWQTQWRTLARAKIAVAVLLVTAAAYNIPRFLEREIFFKTDCATGEVIVSTQKTQLRNNRLYFLIYKTVFYFIFRVIGPLTTLVVLNGRLTRELQVVRRRHRDLTKHSKHRENITMMLIIVVTVFIVCQLPDLGVRIAFTISEFAPSVTVNLEVMRYANVVSNTLLAVNSSVNFVIYCLVGKKFRKILVKMTSCDGGLSSNRGFDYEPSETEHVPLNVSAPKQDSVGRLVVAAKKTAGEVKACSKNGSSNIQVV